MSISLSLFFSLIFVPLLGRKLLCRCFASSLPRGAPQRNAVASLRLCQASQRHAVASLRLCLAMRRTAVASSLLCHAKHRRCFASSLPRGAVRRHAVASLRFVCAARRTAVASLRLCFAQHCPATPLPRFVCAPHRVAQPGRCLASSIRLSSNSLFAVC